jgi:hypothetical protein
MQPLMLTNKTTFQNCLVIMHLKMKVVDLPSINDVRLYLHNTFVQHLNNLKQDIKVSLLSLYIYLLLTSPNQNAPGKVSTTTDGWTTDNTKQGFLGIVTNRYS